MFRTTLIAATLAASAAFAGAASADIVPGSDYGTRVQDEAHRANVASGYVGGSMDAPSALGYTETVPGSDFERRIAQQQTRDMISAAPAVAVSPSAKARVATVPGSDYGVRTQELANRASVVR